MSMRRKVLLAIAACASILWSLSRAMVAQPARALVPIPLPTVDLVSPLPTINLGTPLPTINLGTPLPTVDLLSPLPTVDLVSPLPTINLGTSLPSVDLGTPLPSVNLGTPLPSPAASESGTPFPAGSEPGSEPSARDGPPIGITGPVSVDDFGPLDRAVFTTDPEARQAQAGRTLAEDPFEGRALLEVLEWAVPSVAVAVPLLLLVALLSIQVFGGAAWIHAARPHLDRAVARRPVRPDPAESVEAHSIHPKRKRSRADPGPAFRPRGGPRLRRSGRPAPGPHGYGPEEIVTVSVVVYVPARACPGTSRLTSITCR